MSALPIVFREQALTDLEGISAYISQDNPAAAERVIKRIYTVIFNTIATFPRSGTQGDGLAREFAVPGLQYLIVYIPTDAFIDVIGVFHSARDPASKPRA